MTKQLLVTVDSLRYDHYRVMDETVAYLGESHPHAYATFPATLGSFPAIISGEYATTAGIDPRESVVKYLPEPRIGLTSNHLLSPEYGYDAHFDHFESPSGGGEGIREKLSARIPMGGRLYQAATVAFNIAQRIRATVSDAPRTFVRGDDMIETFCSAVEGEDEWFGWLHFMEPHHPYEPDGFRPSRVHAQNLTRRVLAGWATEEERETVRNAYRREVEQLDGMLAHLWESIPDDTEVIFTADHGELLGEDGRWGHQGELCQRLLHVPFAVRNVDVSLGPLVSLIDVPTILRGEPHGQGTLDRDVAFAAYGERRAAIDQYAILTDTMIGESDEHRDLQRALSQFSLDGGLTRDDALERDLEALGYA